MLSKHLGIALIAGLAAVEAKHHHKAHKESFINQLTHHSLETNLKHWFGTDPFSELLKAFGELTKKEPLHDEPYSLGGDWNYFRVTGQKFTNSILKGLYHSSEDIVTDECFGEWMLPYHEHAKTLLKSFHHDPFSISAQEIKDFGGTLVDGFYKNAEACHFEKVRNDAMYWCQEHIGECVHDQNDLLQNIMDNFEDIVHGGADLFRFIFFDRKRYYANDVEGIEAAARVVEDVSWMISSIVGFDITWDEQTEHMTREMLDDAVHNYWNPSGNRPPVEPAVQPPIEVDEVKLPLLDPVDNMFGGLIPGDE